MATLQNSLPDLKVDLPTAATASPQESSVSASNPPKAAARPPRGPPLYQIYKQPAPLRVFPFPTLTSHPISLVHLAVAWLSHVFFPPAPEPSIVHTAFWDHESRTIVVTGDQSMTDLWQQGFYGKGSLSRSEPNWLKRERIRQGVIHGRVSEVATDKRREDRMHAKWERARAEQEALEQKRRDEAKAIAEADAIAAVAVTAASAPQVLAPPRIHAPVGPLELLALPNSQADLDAFLRDHATTSEESTDNTDASVQSSGLSGNDDADTNTTTSSKSPPLKRSKSVRFSPNVESTVFQHTDPPSPPQSLASSSHKTVPAPTSNSAVPVEDIVSTVQVAGEAAIPAEVVVINKEHLQLAPEEAFFLVFALGALKVVDSVTQQALPMNDLLTLLRQNSYFPPRMTDGLQPDDPFLIHYAVYHHFRSLGWVPRAGIKFGVDCKFTTPLLSIVVKPFRSIMLEAI